MPQELFFNELCLRYDRLRLEQSLENAINGLVQLSELLSLLSRYRNLRVLRTPISFKGTELIEGFKIGRFLSQDESWIDVDHRNNIKRFVDKGRYLEDIEEITDHEGIFSTRNDLYMFRHVELDIFCRGFGASYLLNGLSISLNIKDSFWDISEIQVEKWFGDTVEIVEIEHASKSEHLNLPIRIFERNPKHDLIKESEFVAKLDLSDEEAQEILNLAAQPDKEARYYGYSQRTKRFYAFPSHREGYYHAYPIDLAEIRNRKQVLRQLEDIGVIETSLARRLSKGR